MTNIQFLNKLIDKVTFKKVLINKHRQCYLSYGPDEYIWYINKGILLSERNTVDGIRIGTGIYSKGMILGLKSFYGDSNIINCVALTDSECYGFKTKEVVSVLYDDVDMMYHTLQLACQRFDFALNVVEIQSMKTVVERIDFLEKKLRDIANGEFLEISDNIIAEFLGVHPVSVSRARKQKFK